jgi:hypothetical protein
MPQAPVDYMVGNSRGRNLGARAFSEFEDPTEIRNPYHLAVESANVDLRRRRALADRAEFEASPERQRIDKIQQQQDADYDLEYRAPSRIDMMGKLGIRQAQDKARGARSAGEIEAEGYFDDWTTRRRDNERDFRREQFDRQYTNPTQAKVYDSELDAQAKIESERIKARGGVERARVGGLPRTRETMLNPDTNEVIPGNEGRVDSIDQGLGIQPSKPTTRAKVQQLADAQFGGDFAAAEEAAAARGFYIADED